MLTVSYAAENTKIPMSGDRRQSINLSTSECHASSLLNCCSKDVVFKTIHSVQIISHQACPHTTGRLIMCLKVSLLYLSTGWCDSPSSLWHLERRSPSHRDLPEDIQLTLAWMWHQETRQEAVRLQEWLRFHYRPILRMCEHTEGEGFHYHSSTYSHTGG